MSDIYYDTYNEGEAPEEVNKGKAVLKTVLTAAFVTALAFVILFFPPSTPMSTRTSPPFS